MKPCKYLQITPADWPWVATTRRGAVAWKRATRHGTPPDTSSGPSASESETATPACAWSEHLSLVLATIAVATTLLWSAALGLEKSWLLEAKLVLRETRVLSFQARAAACVCVFAAVVQFTAAWGRRGGALSTLLLRLVLFLVLAYTPSWLDGVANVPLGVWQVKPGACLISPFSSVVAACLGFAAFVDVVSNIHGRLSFHAFIASRVLGASIVLMVLLQLLFSPLLGTLWPIVLMVVALAASVTAGVLTFVYVRDLRRRPAAESACSSAATIFTMVLLLCVAFDTTILAMSGFEESGCPAILSEPGGAIRPLSPAEAALPMAGFVGDEGKRRIREGILSTATHDLIGLIAFVGAAVLVMLRLVDDVSDERRATATQAAESLQQALRVLSHETRGPTNGAVLALALLDDAVAGGRPHEARELVRDLRLSLDRTKRGLDSLLALQAAEADADVSRVDWSWCSAHLDALSAARAAMRGACSAEGVELELAYSDPGTGGRLVLSAALPGSSGWEVYLDADKLTAVCINFVSNALKHAPSSGGRVRLAASVHVVEDTATGDSITGRLSRERRGRGGGGPVTVTGRSRSVLRHGEHRRDGSGSSTARSRPLSRRSISQRSDDVIGPLTEDAAANIMSSAALGREALWSSTLYPLVVPPYEVADGSAVDTGASAASIVDASASRGRNLRFQTAAEAHASAGAAKYSAPARRDQVVPVGEPGLGGSSLPDPPAVGAARPPRGPAPATGVTLAQRCMLVIEALDNGHGMSEDDLASGKLFAPFAKMRQGDGRLRMASTGLGLSIVKSIAVRDMGGAVGVSTKEGEGACFFAMVPCFGRPRQETRVLGIQNATQPARSESSQGRRFTGDDGLGSPCGSSVQGVESSFTGTTQSGASALRPSFLDDALAEANQRRESRILAAATEIDATVRGASREGGVAGAEPPKPRAGARTASASRTALALSPSSSQDSPAVSGVWPAHAAVVDSSAEGHEHHDSVRRAKLGSSLPTMRDDARAEASSGAEARPLGSTVAARGAATSSHPPGPRRGRSPEPHVGRTRDERRARRQGRQHQRSGGSTSRRRMSALSTRALAGPSLQRQSCESVESVQLPPAFVVDDDGVTRQLMARLLRSWGFDVSQFKDGQELVDTVRAELSAATKRGGDTRYPQAAAGAAVADRSADATSPREDGPAFRWPLVVCLDSSMPALDGPDAWAAVRALAEAAGGHAWAAVRGALVVGVSGHVDAAEARRFRSAGATEVMTKPVDPLALKALAVGFLAAAAKAAPDQKRAVPS